MSLDDESFQPKRAFEPCGGGYANCDGRHNDHPCAGNFPESNLGACEMICDNPATVQVGEYGMCNLHKGLRPVGPKPAESPLPATVCPTCGEADGHYHRYARRLEAERAKAAAYYAERMNALEAERDEAVSKSSVAELNRSLPDYPFDIEKQRERIDECKSSRLADPYRRAALDNLSAHSCVSFWAEQIADAELYEEHWNQLKGAESDEYTRIRGRPEPVSVNESGLMARPRDGWLDANSYHQGARDERADWIACDSLFRALLVEGAGLDFEHTCPSNCSYRAWVEKVNNELGIDL